MHENKACTRSRLITCGRSSSKRSPLMSFTICAPASSELRATPDRQVSIEIGILTAAASASITGMTRRVSSSSVIGSLPGRVDSPPTSMRSAPSCSISFPRAIALSRSKYWPPIGKRIRRDVEDAHDSSSIAEWYRSARQIPDVFLSHLSFNSRSCSTEPNK